MTTQETIDFMSGNGEDAFGRTYSEILDYDNSKFEGCHDHIQFIFPLHEESRLAHTKSYPILTKELVDQAKEIPEIINHLRAAKYRFERFLGVIKLEDGTYDDSRHYWCKKKYDHNLPRITRAIRCLRIFGLEKEALELCVNVCRVAINYGEISTPTYGFWLKALKNDIWESLQS